MPSQRTILGEWYDYPQYYDLLCADETDREVAFVEEACRKYCSFPVRTLLEPGCGSGRLVRELARKGFNVVAFDENDKALAYLRRRLARGGLKAQVVHADMCMFSLAEPVDAAYCLMNTFRHLTTEVEAIGHLKSISQTLRQGGLYLLGLHVMPPDASDECVERWTARRGKTKATVTLRVLHTDRRRRLERIRISMRVQRPKTDLRVRTEFNLRRYTAPQVSRLLARVPELDLVDVYDFWYDLENPRRLNRDSEDTVLVLQKR